MIAALKKIVIPHLKDRKFAGKFPHFRRISGSRIDLLTFQFDRHGGGFIFEISQCVSSGFITRRGEHLPPDKVRAWDLHPDCRRRFQPEDGPGTESWFRYEHGDFDGVARTVMPFIDGAEEWWQQKRDLTLFR
jgi:hypothetical protein